MDWQMISFMMAPVLILCGYLHMRLNNVETTMRTSVTESDVKDIISGKLEIVRLQQEQLKERLTRVEEVIDRISDKLDRLLLK